MTVHPAALAFLAFLLVLLPWLAARGEQRLEAAALPRAALYLQAAITQWLLLLVLGGVLWLEGRGPRSLGLLTFLSPARTGRWVAGVLAAGLLVGLLALALRRRLGRAESPLVRHLVPRTAEERWLFALVVAPTAGLIEETLFRGFAVTRLAPLVPGGVWAAALLAVVSFAFGHYYQGALGLARAGVLGALLAVPFVVTGSLLPSVLAHTLLDLAGGLLLGRYLLEEERAPADSSG